MKKGNSFVKQFCNKGNVLKRAIYYMVLQPKKRIILWLFYDAYKIYDYMTTTNN